MLIRDKSRITRMLILLSILRGKKKLKEIAEDIGITIQGVSEYVRTMESEALLKDGEVSMEGLKFISQAIEEMGEFLAEASRLIRKMQVVEAIADEDINEGTRVGLVMKDGYVHAHMREEESMGIAINSAKRGEDVAVSNLTGVLEIDYGKINVYALPASEEGGIKKVPKEKIKRIVSEEAKVGVCGAVAYLALRDLRIDFEFSAVNAAIDAYYRGISTNLFVSHHMLPHVLQTLEDRGVPYHLKAL